jgi:hypothetical protein
MSPIKDKCKCRKILCHLSSTTDSYQPLVLRSSRLASLQLIQIPTADSQATLVIVHALAEAVHIIRASAASLAHGSLLVLLLEVGVLRGLLGRRRGTAAEKAADCVADGGAYCDTAVKYVSTYLHVVIYFEILGRRLERRV